MVDASSERVGFGCAHIWAGFSVASSGNILRNIFHIFENHRNWRGIGLSTSSPKF